MTNHCLVDESATFPRIAQNSTDLPYLLAYGALFVYVRMRLVKLHRIKSHARQTGKWSLEQQHVSNELVRPMC